MLLCLLQTRQNYDLCEGCRYVDEADTNGPYEEIAPLVKVCYVSCMALYDQLRCLEASEGWHNVLVKPVLLLHETREGACCIGTGRVTKCSSGDGPFRSSTFCRALWIILP